MSPRRPVLAVLAVLVALAACSSDPAAVPEQPPLITITGVAGGQVYAAPVTITDAVDRGAYAARLNGQLFVSGTSVETPGAYLLAVTARAGVAPSEARVAFEIALTGSSVLILRVLDLGANDAGGGGDAIVITDSSAAGPVHALVDAGPAGVNASDPGFVFRRLAQLGVDSLAFVLLTHAHSDHFDGLPAVLNGLPVAQFYYNGQIRTLSTYTAVISLAEARADTVIVPDAVVEFRVGLDTATTIVSILPSLADSLDDASAGSSALNDGSLGVRLKCGSFEVFLAGDGEVRANGASGASAWLARAAPALALVSANGTTHPRVRAVTHLLQQRNLRAYCTNGHGTIEVRVNPAGRFRVDVERNAELSCKAGSLADT